MKQVRSDGLSRARTYNITVMSGTFQPIKLSARTRQMDMLAHLLRTYDTVSPIYLHERDVILCLFNWFVTLALPIQLANKEDG